MNLRSIIKRVPFVHAAGRAWNDYRWFQGAQRLGTYSQNREDQALLGLFPKDYIGTYVDLGANHPYRISNTYLLYTRGWRGLCVDAIPTFGVMYQRYRPRDTFLNIGVGAAAGDFQFFEMSFAELSTFSQELANELSSKGRASIVATHRIATAPVADIVRRFAPDGLFDVLSIDIEGLDAEIVRTTDWNFVQPRVIICETSSYEHDWSTEIIGLFKSRGYQHHLHVGCNDVFINTTPGRGPQEL